MMITRGNHNSPPLRPTIGSPPRVREATAAEEPVVLHFWMHARIFRDRTNESVENIRGDLR